jgi:hypothetical protein
MLEAQLKKLKNGEYVLGQFNDNFDLGNKMIARKKIATYIIETGEHNGTILTLPHINCIGERALLKINYHKKFLFLKSVHPLPKYPQLCP